MLYLFILLRIIVNPLGNVFQKQLTGCRGANPVVVNCITYVLLAVACVCIGFPFVEVGALPVGFWIWSAVVGALGAVGNTLLVMALRSGDLSVLGPINSYKSVVGMLFAVLFLGELPTVAGVAGVVLIVAGSYFVFEGTDEGFSWRLLRNRAVVCRLGALVFAAIEAVFIKKVILCSDATTGFVSWCVFGALGSLILVAVMHQPLLQSIRSAKWTDWRLYAMLVLCVGGMQLCTNYVFENMHVGYALALFQLSTLLSVALGYKLFNERNVLKKAIGSLIMIAGSVMIILW